MQKINFENWPSTNSAINATNLNALQDNIEDAISEIVESGSNKNGNYIKYGDGTMIQWQRKSMTINIETAWSGLYYGTAMCDNFPIPFVGDIPTVLGMVYPNSSTWCFGNLVQITARPQSLTYPGDIMVIRPVSTQNVSVIVEIMAIGKWK